MRGYCSACRWEAEQERLSAQIEMDGEAAYAWAAGLLQREDWAILDLETTSLSGAIVEIAVVDREGRTLFHSLVNPQMPITEEARAVHRISDEEVAHAPTLPEVWDAFLQALEGRQVIVTYNTEFDKGILESEARRYGLVRSQQTWHCLMRKYAEYVGDWSDSWHDYRWYPLPSSNHRAVGDALAALTLMQRMAAACATKPLELAQKIEKEGAYG